jgi:hypothetical protein
LFGGFERSRASKPTLTQPRRVSSFVKRPFQLSNFPTQLSDCSVGGCVLGMAMLLELPAPTHGDREAGDETLDLMMNKAKPTLFDSFHAQSLPPNTSICLADRIVSHSFRQLFVARTTNRLYFHFNGSWSDFSIKVESQITSLEWDVNTLFVGTQNGLPICLFKSRSHYR